MIGLKSLTLEYVVCQNPGHIVSDMDGETVMMSIESGKYFNLGEIGGIIWAKISEPKRIESLINLLMQEYEVPKEVCEQQVIDFLQKMQQEKLIKVEKN